MKKLEQKSFKGLIILNIKEAVEESIRKNKLIRRKNSVTSTVFMPTNTYYLIVVWSNDKRRLPVRGW